MIIAIFIAGISIGNVFAATNLKLYDYSVKKEMNYTDKQIKVIFNGSQISKNETPGILKNGSALVSYQDIFENSVVDAECSYDALTKTITISKYSNTIVMIIGNKKANVNGKTVTMPVEPLQIKYMNAKVTKILVPSRFVAENLGMAYTWNSSNNTVEMVKKTLELSYNGGTKLEYTGVFGQVTIDGRKLSLGDMPSIIMNNTAMLRVKKVFADSNIKASYTYNSTDKSITLKKNGNTLVMTLGSTTAYLNGNPTALDTAPISVKNYKNNLSFIMVPGSFTASCLGYDYAWNKGNATSMITTRKEISNSSGMNGGATELGDGGTTDGSDKIIAQWNTNITNIGIGSGCHEINSNMTSLGKNGRIYTAARDYNTSQQNAERFVISGDMPFEKVTSNISGNMITIKAEDKTCSDATLPMVGTYSNIVNNIKLVNNQSDNSTTVVLELLTQNYNYEISLSEDGYSLYVTIYQNSLTSVTIGTNSVGDYITLTGLSAITPVVTKDGSFTYIDLPYIKNIIGEMYQTLSGTRFINLFNAMNLNDKTRLMVSTFEGYETQTIQNGNQCTIYFKTPGATIPTTNQGETNTSDDIDKSKCEIVIPIPVGISGNMITDEDFYYKNKFVIRIPGDYTTFYKTSTIIRNSSIIKDISVTLNSSNVTEITITTSRLQGYKYSLDNNNIYINIGDPREIYKNIVVLDAGHGGGAVGANYFGTYEKDVNFKILYTIGKKYFNSDPSKLKVYYIRTSDVDMSLADRAAFAKKVGADLFVSLHMNAVAKNADLARGTAVYYSAGNNKPNSAGLTSEKMASLMVDDLAYSLGTCNNGEKAANFTVIYRNTVPAVLIELGFLSNKNDYALITNETFQDNAARIIYQSLLEMFDTYPTGR